MGDDTKTDAEFERVWESADWTFKNDRQDAKYFFLRGQQVEIVKQQLREVDQHERERKHESQRTNNQTPSDAA